jgi:Zn-dependent metalloprotease
MRHAHSSACTRSMACIVPPDLLRRIILEGEPEERSAAVDTLTLDGSIRMSRAEIAGRRTIGQRTFASLVSTGGQPNRTIFDQHHKTNGVGTVVRAEGHGATADPAVNEAYDGLGATYDFYWKVFQRDSIDGAGMPLQGLVHYGSRYNNAFWDGTQMYFGDGDGVYFTRFTASLDVIAHELAHGVTEHEANLIYSRQSGALNESLSDVFGSLVKQHHLGQKAEDADWLIGADCVGPKLAKALRSMKAPGTANPFDDQPADMDAFVKTADDNGGVHTNSGIPNRAFYLAASQIGGYAWEAAGQIWFDALRDPRIRPNSGFASFARATLRHAGSVYGASSAEMTAVQNAWTTVKVL